MSDIIDDVIKREGPETDDPQDGGGRTAFGISESSNPEAWKDGKVTEEEARAIYEAKYLKGPGFDKIEDPTLKAQLVDFGVTSGPYIAIQKLQAVLGTSQDGKLGPKTLAAAKTSPGASNRLLRERVLMICRLVKKDPSQLKYLEGWVSRAFEFLV